MTDLPSTLTYFGSLSAVSQILTKTALPLIESHQLNDAFLPEANTELAFNAKVLFDTSVKYIAGAIFSKSAPVGQPTHPLQKAIMRWRMEERFNDESEVKEALQGLLPSMVEKSYTEAQKSHADWNNYVSTIRLIPFYEKYQELDLWERHGLFLKGAAIKFSCPDESIFTQCRAVKYSKKPASTTKILNYVEQMVGVISEVKTDFKDVLLTQNYKHKNEKEWRLITQSQEAFLMFPANLIKSVYLGASVKAGNIEKLKNHLAKFYPQVNLYHAKCKSDEYALDFIKISNNQNDSIENNE